MLTLAQMYARNESLLRTRQRELQTLLGIAHQTIATQAGVIARQTEELQALHERLEELELVVADHLGEEAAAWDHGAITGAIRLPDRECENG